MINHNDAIKPITWDSSILTRAREFPESISRDAFKKMYEGEFIHSQDGNREAKNDNK